MVVGEAAGVGGCASRRSFGALAWQGICRAEVQTASVLVRVRLDVTTGIRLRCEAVVGVVCLHHRSAIRIGLAKLQPCVSRLKLIDSVRLNEKMFDESGIV